MRAREHACRYEQSLRPASRRPRAVPARGGVVVFAAALFACALAMEDARPAGESVLKSAPFAHPRRVEIRGLPIGFGGTPISTEEPFVSRDGRFLFFNSGKRENRKDLHYAERLAGRWVYRGPLGPRVNDPREVQANPTMDRRCNLLYLDTAGKTMIRIARFSPDRGRVDSIRDVDGLPGKKVELFARKVRGNMGVEVSADGSYLFFSRATWRLKRGSRGFTVGKLLDSDILFARREGTRYVYDAAETRRMMGRINTPDLEYAASISTDGLELFFTRLALADYKSGRIRSRILRAARPSVTAPFGEPEMVRAIGSRAFVEGPAISGDGKTLYYHKLDGAKFRIYQVRRGGSRRSPR